MYLRACHRDDLIEGGLELAAVGGRLVLILWPKGGSPRAFQGFCPHKREPLADGFFDGETLVCRHHDWVFDAGSGRCLDGKPCELAEYPLKVEDEIVLVEVDGVEENQA